MSKKKKLRVKDRHPKNSAKAKLRGLERHQYLEDLGYKLENCGVNYVDNTDKRYKYWKKFKKLYNVDPRETWNLDSYFFEWLYERVTAYKEIAGSVVDLDDPNETFLIDGKNVTLIGAINILLDVLKDVIAAYKDISYVNDKKIKKGKKAIAIWQEIFPAMWW